MTLAYYTGPIISKNFKHSLVKIKTKPLPLVFDLAYNLTGSYIQLKTTLLIFNCSNSTKETLEKGVKYVQS